MTFAKEPISALIAAIAALTLYALLESYEAKANVWSFLTIGLVGAPVAVVITVLVELPLYYLIKNFWRANFLVCMMVPFLSVLAITLIFFLDQNSTINVLNDNGHVLIRGGQINWKNLHWFILYCSEPAWFAGLAGIIFWLLAVRKKMGSSPRRPVSEA